MSVKLKTLEEHNQEALKDSNFYVQFNLPKPNGIACPQCGKEMYDSNPMIILTSHPAQKNIHCKECGYVGYRYA